MRDILGNIAQFQSGIYQKPDINADTFYLQTAHFNQSGLFDQTVRPQLKFDSKIEKYLLKEGDLLFAAKGINNFAVVYHAAIGNAIASSSFIRLRLNEKYKQIVLPDYMAWYISHNKKMKLLHQQQLGTTVSSVNMKDLSDLEIDIPSLEIQEKVVSMQQLREQEKKLKQQIEAWKDKQIQLLLSKAITK